MQLPGNLTEAKVALLQCIASPETAPSTALPMERALCDLYVQGYATLAKKGSGQQWQLSRAGLRALQLSGLAPAAAPVMRTMVRRKATPKAGQQLQLFPA